MTEGSGPTRRVPGRSRNHQVSPESCLAPPPPYVPMLVPVDFVAAPVAPEDSQQARCELDPDNLNATSDRDKAFDRAVDDRVNRD
jgi:hypothetical protein